MRNSQLVWTFSVWLAALGLFNPAGAAIVLYRSVQPGQESQLDQGSGTRTLSITSSIANISGASVPLNVGIGDGIRYNGGTQLAIIAARIDGNNFAVQTTGGAEVSAFSTPDSSWEIFRIYTSLANAMVGIENTYLEMDFDMWSGGAPLKDNDSCMFFACYAGVDTVPVVISSAWQTEEANYVRIFTPTASTEVGISQRHQGKWDGGSIGYCLRPSTGVALTIQTCNVKVEGIQFQIPGNTDYRKGIEINNQRQPLASRYYWFSNNLFQGQNTGKAYHYGIHIISSTVDSRVFAWNNVFDSFYGASDSGGIISAMPGNTLVACNNTFSNCRIGIGLMNSGVTGYAINNISQGAEDGYYGTFAVPSNYNISSIPSDSPGNTFPDNTLVQFQSSSTGDFHLAADDINAKDTGTDARFYTAETLLSFDNDMDMESRNGVWDVGADEYFAPTPTPTATMTFTATITPTQTVSSTQTVSPTSSVTFSCTPTATITPTVTITPTSTLVITLTPTTTATVTATRENTATVLPATEMAYPNPAAGNNITFVIQSLGEEQISVHVYTAAYQEIWRTQVSGVPNQMSRIEWNISRIPPGIYLYQIETGSRKSAVKKIAVIK